MKFISSKIKRVFKISLFTTFSCIILMSFQNCSPKSFKAINKEPIKTIEQSSTVVSTENLNLGTPTIQQDNIQESMDMSISRAVASTSAPASSVVVSPAVASPSDPALATPAIISDNSLACEQWKKGLYGSSERNQGLIRPTTVFLNGPDFPTSTVQLQLFEDIGNNMKNETATLSKLYWAADIIDREYVVFHLVSCERRITNIPYHFSSQLDQAGVVVDFSGPSKTVVGAIKINSLDTIKLYQELLNKFSGKGLYLGGSQDYRKNNFSNSYFKAKFPKEYSDNQNIDLLDNYTSNLYRKSFDNFNIAQLMRIEDLISQTLTRLQFIFGSDYKIFKSENYDSIGMTNSRFESSAGFTSTIGQAVRWGLENNRQIVTLPNEVEISSLAQEIRYVSVGTCYVPNRPIGNTHLSTDDTKSMTYLGLAGGDMYIVACGRPIQGASQTIPYYLYSPYGGQTFQSGEYVDYRDADGGTNELGESIHNRKVKIQCLHGYWVVETESAVCSAFAP